MQESINRVGQVKAILDSGMCRVGPGLDRSSAADAWLSGAASRSIALADAVVQLCRHDHPNEALPLVRQLAEAAVCARWLVSGDRAARERVLAEESAAAQWDGLWRSDRFLSRVRECGFPEEGARQALAWAREFLQGGRAALPWSHVFPGNQHPGADAESVLRLTVRLLDCVLEALDVRWPGNFK